VTASSASFGVTRQRRALSPSSATSVTLQADNTAAADAPDCVVTGHALQNGGGGLIGP
jgi:uncharacterized lipoprotein YbaY